jgi:hypothetical protein
VSLAAPAAVIIGAAAAGGREIRGEAPLCVAARGRPRLEQRVWTSGDPQHRDDASMLGIGAHRFLSRAAKGAPARFGPGAFSGVLASRCLGFRFDLGHGVLEVLRRHPPHYLSPAPANRRAGPDPEARLAAPSHLQ